MPLVLCMCTPPRTKVRPIDVKKAIRHAQKFHPKAPEYKQAWDDVEELSSELARQMIETKNGSDLCVDDPLACREYDV
jgi:hypothetical protein